MTTAIFKICSKSLWQQAVDCGRFDGAPVDLADGFIHLSTADQVEETARKHFSGHEDLVIIAINPETVEPILRWEASRGGDLYPHVYGVLEPALADWVEDLPLGPDGRHVFPDRIFRGDQP